MKPVKTIIDVKKKDKNFWLVMWTIMLGKHQGWIK
jgi:hypothetical protein